MRAPTLTRSYTLANTALNTTQNITFSVDMNAQIAVGAFDPALDFIYADWGADFSLFQLLEDIDGDGIYTGTAEVSAPEGTPVPYRYTIEATSLVPENVSRSFTMPGSALSLTTVFFNNIAGYRDVTFTVDMSVQETLGAFDPATQTVEVRGGFNNWAGTTLTAQGGGIYSGTLTIGSTAGQTENYKFYASGPGALTYESGDNRTFTMEFNPGGAPEPAIVLPTVFFSNQDTVPEFRAVTFSVDMSYQISEGNFDPATGVVQVRGPFNSWGGTELTAGENGIYSGTINITGAAGASVPYKFWATGPDWETIDNRTFTLGPAGVTQVLTPTPFFNNDSGQIRDITFSVDMSVQVADGNFDPATGVVQLRGLGGFGDAEAQPLTREGETLIYSGTFAVPGDEGSSFGYKFWATGLAFEVIDPNDGLVNRTTVLGPSGVAEVLPTVFFSNQSTPTPVRDVTFSVDMSVQIALGNFDPATGVVEVRGPFNDWVGTALTAGENGIYSGTTSVAGNVGANMQYKFWATGLDYEGGSDRTFVLGAGGVAQTLPTVYFSDDSGQTRDVTFSVDMSVQIALGNFDPATGVVEVRGSFNGFASGSVLTDQGGGIYGGTFLVEGVQGESVSYKFWATGLDYESGNDRTFVLEANGAAQTLPTVYFSNNSGQVRDITFSVDMSVQVTDGNFDPATGVVQLRGLGGFGEAEAQPLTRVGETLVYSGTFAVPGAAGSEFAYKFWATGLNFEVVVPADPFANRTTTLGPSGVAEVLPTVFFSNQSTPTPTREVTFSVDMSVQIALGNFNPVDGVVEVRGSFNEFAGGDVLTDQGGGIYSGTFTIAGAEGASAEYKFYAANAGTDPVVPGFEAGGDRTLVLGPGGVAQVLPTVFFSNESGQSRDVTFSVDMSVQILLGAFDPATGVVEVRGSFNGFSGGDVLSDQGGGIYSGTFNVEGADGEAAQYKFWATGLDYEAGSDRSFTLGPDGVAQVLPTVYFSNDSGQVRDVNFSVDMSIQISLGTFDPATGVVEVRGPFNGWNGTALTAQGAGIYSGTVSIAGPAGDTEQYKFWATGLTWEIIDGNEQTNRTFVLGTSGVLQILPTVFFSNQSSAGETFANWSGGQPLTPALELEYAIGGASAPGAGDGVPSVTTLTADTLSITAVVRTNDPTLTVNGQTLTNLLVGPWTTNNVTVTVVDPQPANVPEGCEVQVFSTPRGTDGQKFLRLQTTLPAQD